MGLPELFGEEDRGVDRRAGDGLQDHSRLMGSSIAFGTVARLARGDEVIPSVPAAFRSGNDVIESQFEARPAVLATVFIPFQHFPTVDRGGFPQPFERSHRQSDGIGNPQDEIHGFHLAVPGSQRIDRFGLTRNE